ncbi:MAG: polysaccharide biosynthesis/export family protein [Gemmatimonadota bacterium]
MDRPKFTSKRLFAAGGSCTMPSLHRRELLVAILIAAAPPVYAQTTASTVTPANPAADHLRPGDVIRMKVWREPDFSGDFSVDDRGEAVFPRIGPLLVTEQSAASLRDRLVTEYQKYLSQTSIEINVLRRVRVDGAVRTPGLYSVDATMTLGDALALAGGVSSEGNRKKVVVVRDGESITLNARSTLPLASTPVRSGDHLYVPERSWVSRNPYILGAIVSGVATIATFMIRR